MICVVLELTLLYLTILALHLANVKCFCARICKKERFKTRQDQQPSCMYAYVTSAIHLTADYKPKLCPKACKPNPAEEEEEEVEDVVQCVLAA